MYQKTNEMKLGKEARHQKCPNGKFEQKIQVHMAFPRVPIISDR